MDPRPTADLAALRAALREPIIRAVAGLDGYKNPNLEAGAWWEKRTKPVLDAVIAALAATDKPEPTWLSAPDPRCSWHDPGVSMANLRPQACKHWPEL